ncbi:MAG: hypothetical protein JSU68_00955 [Phycisphaerales bacterium]|nr:MAG: hypothetical protein JSU68_00955 [Phycisphaerales bacterium]
MRWSKRWLCCAAVVAGMMTASAPTAMADTIFESFEGDLRPWRAEEYTPLLWYVLPTQDTAQEGSWAVDITADGRADDGTIWLVREIQLPAGTWNIGLEFYTIGYPAGTMGVWPTVAFIGPYEPQVETDFTQSEYGFNLGMIVGSGWTPVNVSKTLDVSQPTVAYVAFGTNITFEVERTHYFDSATITGVPVQCGNGDCFGGEDACNCPADCGPPAGSESICDDGIDDDCDGFTDCVDGECTFDPVCEGIVCDGDSVCETGEHSCYCWVDCGPWSLYEWCDDEIDNNCNGLIDCDDFFYCGGAPECWEPPPCDYDGTCEEGEDCNNCPNDCYSASGAICGNDVCEIGDGEDCLSCPADCNGVQGGKPSGRYCCGDGAGSNPVGCGDPRCTGDGNTCTAEPALASCCGDGTCEGTEDSYNCAIDCGAPPGCGDGTCDPGEDPCNCPDDCGAPPASETDCTDGVDEDCDSLTDCGDDDCAGDPACADPCGDDFCDTGGGEDQCNCPEDCGTPPASEGNCTNGFDDDCDGPADCEDSDCAGDPACACLPKGAACSTDGECCSNWCHRGACK